MTTVLSASNGRANRITTSRVEASRPLKGSSMMTIGASVSSARTMATRRCIPPLSSRTGRSADASNPTAASASEMRRLEKPWGSAMHTLADGERWAISRSSWKTAAQRSGRPEIRPESGWSSPISSRSSVVLPTPDGPVTQLIDPSRKVWQRLVSTGWSSKATDRLRSSTSMVHILSSRR